MNIPPLHILVVDDDPLVAAAVRLRLESAGHRASAAAGGQLGIDAFMAAAAQGDPFHVVMTDLSMPRVNGEQVAAAVKAACPATIVIVLTGLDEPLRSEVGSRRNVDWVMSKPPTLEGIHLALSQLLHPGAPS